LLLLELLLSVILIVRLFVLSFVGRSVILLLLLLWVILLLLLLLSYIFVILLGLSGGRSVGWVVLSGNHAVKLLMLLLLLVVHYLHQGGHSGQVGHLSRDRIKVTAHLDEGGRVGFLHAGPPAISIVVTTVPW